MWEMVFQRHKFQKCSEGDTTLEPLVERTLRRALYSTWGRHIGVSPRVVNRLAMPVRGTLQGLFAGI